MGIIDLFRKKEFKEEIKEKTEEKDFNLQVVPLSTGEQISSKAGKYLDSYTEWVYANVSLRAKAISGIEFELYQVNKREEPTLIETHEILETLQYANNFQSKNDLLFTYQTHKDLTGEAVWYLDRNGSDNPKEKPTAMWPLRPDYLKVYPGDLSKGNFIDHYEYEVPGKDKLIFKPYEILHFKNVNPKNPYRGLGIIEAASVSIDTDNFASEYNRRFFLNNARPDAILYTDQRLQEDTFKRLLRQWNQKFLGVSNSHKLAILESGLKYEQIQMSQNDMQFLEQQKWTRNKIMALFGNTPTMLGIVEDVNRANAETSEYVWTKHTIKPLMQSLCDYLNEFFVPLFADNLFLSFKDPTPQDEAALTNELNLLTNKIYTFNEARALKGLPPIEGGDAIYQAFSLQPVGTELETIEPNKDDKKILVLQSKKRFNPSKKDLSREVRLLKNRNLRRKKQVEELNKSIYEVVSKLYPHTNGKKKIVKKEKEYINKQSYDTKLKFHKNLLKIASTYEERMKSILKLEIYPVMERQTIMKIQFFVKNKKALSDFEFDEGEIIKVATMNFMPLVEEIIRMEGEEALRYLDINEQFDTTSNLVRNAFTKHTSKFCKSLTKTAQDDLIKSLSEGLDSGEGQQQLIKRVKGVIKNLNKTQATRIAITETSRATNIGLLQAFKQGGVEGKEWFTAEDERVCPFCDEMAEKTADLSDTYFDLGDTMEVEKDGKIHSYKFDYEPIESPPLHASCRCTLVPVFKTSKAIKNPNYKEILEGMFEEKFEKFKSELIDKAVTEAVKNSEAVMENDRVKLQMVVDKIEEELDGDR